MCELLKMVRIDADICEVTIMPSYINVLAAISCVSSIIGGVVIFVTYAVIPEVRNTSRKMLLALSCADMLTAAVNLVGIARYLYLKTSPDFCRLLMTSDDVCIAQSFITTFSSMASFFWTVAIAAHVLRQLTHSHEAMACACQLVGFHVVCWGIPGAIMVYVASSSVLGQDNSVATGGWCWIRSDLRDSSSVAWMIVSGKGWEILCYVLTATLYVLSKLQIRILNRVNSRQGFSLDTIADFRKEDQIYLYVPFILYVLRFWGTVRFFLALQGDGMNSVGSFQLRVALVILQSIGDSWQAFWNFVLFCLVDKTVRRHMCSALAPCFARLTCCRRPAPSTDHANIIDQSSIYERRINERCGLLNSSSTSSVC